MPQSFNESGGNNESIGLNSISAWPTTISDKNPLLDSSSYN